jgi:hypothetical protein
LIPLQQKIVYRNFREKSREKRRENGTFFNPEAFFNEKYAG